MNSRLPVIGLIILILASGFSSCAPAASVSVSKPDDTGVSVPAGTVADYDSVDTAVLVSLSTVNNTATFYNFDLCRSYTLSYDGTTVFTDKYGTALSAGQVKPGTVADICFLHKAKKLVSFSDSVSAFRISDLTGFSFNIDSKVFEYKGDSYKITGGTILLADGRPVSLSELNPLDSVTICGYDNSIYSITVDRGHGYLKLKGNEPFNGGYLDTGAGDIELIGDGMLLILPEGDYSMTVTKNGGSAVRHVTIEPGKETTLDLTGVVIKEASAGKILFDVTPESAKVYVDGNLVDQTRLLSFPQGLHFLSVTAEGYQSITRYFNLGKDTASLEIVLEESGDQEKKDEEEAKTEGYYVFVTNPSDVEVYLDGNYVGMSPVSFAKTAGSHTITLRKSGYETRTYTVLVENAGEDVYYSFDSLQRTDGVTNDASGNNSAWSGSGSSSGNGTNASASGNNAGGAGNSGTSGSGSTSASGNQGK